MLLDATSVSPLISRHCSTLGTPGTRPCSARCHAENRAGWCSCAVRKGAAMTGRLQSSVAMITSSIVLAEGFHETEL
jgi:hypothetical protein